MTKSTPPRKFLSKRRDLFFFVFLLAAIAVYSSYGSKQNSRVSISGIQLHQDREFVEKKLQSEDYRSFHSSPWEQHWHKQEAPDITVIYKEDDSIQSIKGGRAEVDGRDATYWSLEQLREKLGPAKHGGQGRAIGEEAHVVVSYPQYRLLVQRGETTNFVLFQSGRRQ